VAFRVLQGLGGGAIIPTAQSILFARYPRKEHGTAQALFGLGAVTAPLLGPSLGGYLVEVANWHWIFLINVPVGILSLLLTQRIVHDPAYLRNMRKSNFRVDYIGIGLIIIGVGFLQTGSLRASSSSALSSPLSRSQLWLCASSRMKTQSWTCVCSNSETLQQR